MTLNVGSITSTHWSFCASSFTRKRLQGSNNLLILFQLHFDVSSSQCHRILNSLRSDILRKKPRCENCGFSVSFSFLRTKLRNNSRTKKYLRLSFPDGVKSDRSNHLVVFHLFEVATVALCGDTTCTLSLWWEGKCCRGTRRSRWSLSRLSVWFSATSGSICPEWNHHVMTEIRRRSRENKSNWAHGKTEGATFDPRPLRAA